MNGFLKDDLTVALDEVDRIASRIVTIYEDLSVIASDPGVSRRLSERGEAHRRALVGFNRARSAAGQIPEVGDPERAHLQSLWLALKSAVAGEHSEERLQSALAELDDQLCAAIQTARAFEPPAAVGNALEDLTAQLQRPA